MINLFLAACKIFSLSVTFDILIIVCFSVDLSGFIFLRMWLAGPGSMFPFLGLGNFQPLVFQIDFFFYLFSGTPIIWLLLYLVLSCKSLIFILPPFFSFCCSVWVSFIILSSSLLGHSLLHHSLLLNPYSSVFSSAVIVLYCSFVTSVCEFYFLPLCWSSHCFHPSFFWACEHLYDQHLEFFIK